MKNEKPAIYASMYPILKGIANKYGYALTIHGSLQKDLDLVAIPWVEDTGDVEKMLKEISRAIDGQDNLFDGKPYYATKNHPHGRISYCLKSGLGYFDISVMPINPLAGSARKEFMMEKCKIENNKISVCPSLERSLDGKTVRLVQIYDKESNPTKQVVVLHSGNGDRKNKGVVLNFCPFCAGVLFNDVS